jgi:hypothetical protein
VSPFTPLTPETPEIPQAPVVPVTPLTPLIPDTPLTPQAPATPETPLTPDTPETPQAPVSPFNADLKAFLVVPLTDIVVSEISTQTTRSLSSTVTSASNSDIFSSKFAISVLCLKYN